ncbi:MAG: hypothetical protein G8345_12785 [Magnetococcales bacterium]|nr:hypothetical protein [Magnetococcales bacterium]NGZ27747.1 hypothetical protein [Magnetococcales bacterium]
MIREPNKKQRPLPSFENPFEQNLDQNNRWVRLAEVVPWVEFSKAYYSSMSSEQAAPAKPAPPLCASMECKQSQHLRRNLGYIGLLLDRYSPPEPAPLGGLKPNLGQKWPDNFTYRHIRQLWIIRVVYEQQKQMYASRLRSHQNRIVSISQRHVRPIIRGKAGVAAEFGAKLSASMDDNGLSHVDALRWEAFNESANLPGQVEAYKNRYGHYPAVVLADGIYGMRENRNYCKE